MMKLDIEFAQPPMPIAFGNPENLIPSQGIETGAGITVDFPHGRPSLLHHHPENSQLLPESSGLGTRFASQAQPEELAEAETASVGPIIGGRTGWARLIEPSERGFDNREMPSSGLLGSQGISSGSLGRRPTDISME